MNSTKLAGIRTVSDVEQEPITWLWPGKIPSRKYSLIAGDPGLGKSMVTVDIAARITTGAAFPDGTTPPKGDVLFIVAEDDIADTVRPRLDAAMADMRRVHVLDYKNDNGKKRLVNLSDVAVFIDALKQIRDAEGTPRAIFIDPVTAYLAGRDSKTDSDVRELLAPLAVMARKEDIAIIGVQHLNKGGGPAAYRVGGSIAFTAAARAVWIVTRDKEDETTRMFLPLKMNLSGDVGGWSYQIEEDRENTPFVHWIGPVETSAREALEPEHNHSRVAPLQDQIKTYLDNHGPSRTGDIAAALGKSESSISNGIRKLRSRNLVEPTGVYGEWRTFTTKHPHESNKSIKSDESTKQPEQGTFTTYTTFDTFTGGRGDESTDETDDGPDIDPDFQQEEELEDIY